MTPFPTPHLDKLKAALVNEKLPASDAPRINAAITRYENWIKDLEAVTGTPEEVLAKSVGLLGEYRKYIDVDLIFDSDQDFLYRQKGQLKLDNSVIEEFLPRLVTPAVIPMLKDIQVEVGPRCSFSSLFFISSLDAMEIGGGPNVREKNQDFAISKPLYIRTSHSAGFEQGQYETVTTNIAYIAAECKTNLDKTMFQEACATARDTMYAVSGAHYFLLAEWLDMRPLSTASTDIEEVILLRKAKRMNSNVREAYDKAANRKARRTSYVEFLENRPFRVESFKRFVSQIESLIKNEAPDETSTLERGYF